ncbi:MAG TPA: GNAT family N-acetyltransferase [Polyangiaceae bacterium]|nr:GNAT family N-acetyltransferase [Polyangiaceae bacterium]
MQLALERISEQDEPFLYDVYASTREEELSVVPWTAAEREAFLRMQFDAQHRYYRQAFSEAEFSKIVVDGVSVGRLYVDRRPSEIRIIDIALLPAFRGRGIGTRLLSTLIAEAEGRGVPVRIHVERMNRARTLYERLGFARSGGDAVYELMECPPSSRAGGVGGGR